jgi:hypothetical protein
LVEVSKYFVFKALAGSSLKNRNKQLPISLFAECSLLF